MATDIEYTLKTRDDFLKEVVSQLVALRKKRRLTQEELNYRLGIAERLVSKWECGIRTPTSFNLYCWADALDGKLMIAENLERPIKSMEGNFGIIRSNNIKYYTPANDNMVRRLAA